MLPPSLVATDIARGLEHLSFIEPAIVHCDIKAENVLVAQNFTCKIADLGGSRYLRKPETHKGAPMSLLYASPQRCQCGSLALSDDTYSFGLLMYELFTQELAYLWALEDEMSPSWRQWAYTNGFPITPVTDLGDFRQRVGAGQLPVLCPYQDSPYALVMLQDPILMAAWEEVALGCVQFEAAARPTMRNAAARLAELLQVHST